AGFAAAAVAAREAFASYAASAAGRGVPVSAAAGNHVRGGGERQEDGTAARGRERRGGRCGSRSRRNYLHCPKNNRHRRRWHCGDGLSRIRRQRFLSAAAFLRWAWRCRLTWNSPGSDGERPPTSSLPVPPPPPTKKKGFAAFSAPPDGRAGRSFAAQSAPAAARTVIGERCGGVAGLSAASAASGPAVGAPVPATPPFRSWEGFGKQLHNMAGEGVTAGTTFFPELQDVGNGGYRGPRSVALDGPLPPAAAALMPLQPPPPTADGRGTAARPGREAGRADVLERRRCGVGGQRDG
ncbi:unnamed protein product, partial [Phaeothamnion confervicola]